MALFHGYMSCKESFYYQIERLKQNYCVLSFDFLGFGKSSPLTKPFSVDDYADWVYRLLLSQNAIQVHILAHSFGARVALKLIYKYPQAAKSLIITGGAGIVKPRGKDYYKKIKMYRLVKKFFPRYAQKHFGSAEYKKLDYVMRESYKKIVNEDLSVCAASVNCPTLLIYGREDTTTPPAEEGQIFNGLIKGSRLIIMQGGHFCFSEYPQTFNAKIMDFLSERQ